MKINEAKRRPNNNWDYDYKTKLFEDERELETNRLPDSGERREFDSGAVRDIVEGKGRMDLMPLWFLSKSFPDKVDGDYRDLILKMNDFIYTGNDRFIYDSICTFVRHAYDDNYYTAVLELSKHYEAGALKYGERNWEKGIPLHSYVDSALRHLTKYFAGYTEEPHDRAYLWNLFGILYTQEHFYDDSIIDLPYRNKDAK